MVFIEIADTVFTIFVLHKDELYWCVSDHSFNGFRWSETNDTTKCIDGKIITTTRAANSDITITRRTKNYADFDEFIKDGSLKFSPRNAANQDQHIKNSLFHSFEKQILEPLRRQEEARKEREIQDAQRLLEILKSQELPKKQIEMADAVIFLAKFLQQHFTEKHPQD